MTEPTCDLIARAIVETSLKLERGELQERLCRDCGDIWFVNHICIPRPDPRKQAAEAYGLVVKQKAPDFWVRGD